MQSRIDKSKHLPRGTASKCMHSQRLVLTLLAAALISAAKASAQAPISCESAVSQLQAYAQQVNAIAQVEYYQGIPARCGMNAYCAQALLTQLTAWFGQQSTQINNWYTTIQRVCSERRTARRPKQTDPTEAIDVDDLDVEQDDRQVRIRIPSNPSGYRRRVQ